VFGCKGLFVPLCKRHLQETSTSGDQTDWCEPVFPEPESLEPRANQVWRHLKRQSLYLTLSVGSLTFSDVADGQEAFFVISENGDREIVSKVNGELPDKLRETSALVLPVQIQLSTLKSPNEPSTASWVIYKGIDGGLKGKLWARPELEFADGRFEQLRKAPISEPDVSSPNLSADPSPDLYQPPYDELSVSPTYALSRKHRVMVEVTTNKLVLAKHAKDLLKSILEHADKDKIEYAGKGVYLTKFACKEHSRVIKGLRDLDNASSPPTVT
jgi:hypothetical protein